MTLARGELDQPPGAAADALADGRRNLDRAVEHDDPGALVDLMLRQALPAARSSAIARAASLDERISGSRGLRSSALRSQLFNASSVGRALRDLILHPVQANRRAKQHRHSGRSEARLT